MYSKVEQIRILKEAKENLIRHKYGLCGAIRHASPDSNDGAIPLFNKENCLMVCRDKKIKRPNFQYGYWWELGNNKSRFAFINWAIKELQK